MEIASVDLGIVGIIAVSALISLIRGFVKEAMSLVIWIIAFAVAMNFKEPLAEHLVSFIGLASIRQLVAWGGFKSNVEQERSNEFFKVRLWNQNDLIDQVLSHYEDLDNYIIGEIPLKSFWTIASDLD